MELVCGSLLSRGPTPSSFSTTQNNTPVQDTEVQFQNNCQLLCVMLSYTVMQHFTYYNELDWCIDHYMSILATHYISNISHCKNKIWWVVASWKMPDGILIQPPATSLAQKTTMQNQKNHIMHGPSRSKNWPNYVEVFDASA